LEGLDSEAWKSGRQFEDICRWFLTNDPLYRQELRRVWSWDEWPGRWAADAGIDLVAEDHEGRLWAVQSKAYDPRHRVTKADVDSFLSESNRPEFSFRLLIATTDRIGVTARRTLEAQEKQVGFVGLAELEASDLDWPAGPSHLRPRTRPAKKPRAHQRRAVEAVVAGFASTDRGQLIMACGTGKTLVALFTAERLKPTRTLVLVPSLSLLSQTLREWVTNATTAFVPLAVCSDETVADRDAPVATTTELGMPVTTDPASIAGFLRGRNRRVIFATYQSSPRIAEAYRLASVPRLDLIVADEAHRCAGRVSSEFTTVLDATALPARRRLFMTATPRYFTGRVVREAREADFEVASMDDESRFGPVFHRLSFGEAIARDLLCDYQVAVVGVDDATYKEWAEQGRLISLDGRAVTDARTVAGQIGLAKAIRSYGLRRSITFHSRVAAARRFAQSLPDVIDWMPAAERPKGTVWATMVSGEMSAGQRNVQLGRLRNLEAGSSGVLANARCLSEGVDVPTLDGVAFIDPRRSEIDIVQAVGRAIRTAEDKTVGTIVIPVFVGSDDEPEATLDSSVFQPVWGVLKALRAHDEDLAEQLDSLRRDLGRGMGTIELPSKIHLDLPARVHEDFATAFGLRLVEATTRPWEFWFGLLERYLDEHGDARVPDDYQVDGHLLGRWAQHQRTLYRSGRIEPRSVSELERLPGWSWSPRDESWEEGIERLLAFVKRNGHALVSQGHVEEGYPLGRWVSKQRHAPRSERDNDRYRRLSELPGWSWDVLDFQWENGFAALLSFLAREGHATVPEGHVENGNKLASWVARQRFDHSRGRLSEERTERLEAMPTWQWNLDRWEQGYRHLETYCRREGHALVPDGHVEDGHRLGQWVGVQRSLYAAGRLREDRATRLEQLPGWAWTPHETRWQSTYDLLLAFVEREGHARVPHTHREGSVNLGTWVTTQRRHYRRGTLIPQRVARLEVLPGWTWSPRKGPRRRQPNSSP
jgi:superfamily II DNA or RNA helicase